MTKAISNKLPAKQNQSDAPYHFSPSAHVNHNYCQNDKLSIKPPAFEPITPMKVSKRWFPKGRKFGLYESGGCVAPNVTSILAWKFPFDKAKWVKSEPDIDHDAVTKESAERGTAVHLAMEKWLQSEEHTPMEEHLQWINPLGPGFTSLKNTGR